MVNKKIWKYHITAREIFGGGLNAFHVCEVTGREHSYQNTFSIFLKVIRSLFVRWKVDIHMNVECVHDGRSGREQDNNNRDFDIWLALIDFYSFRGRS